LQGKIYAIVGPKGAGKTERLLSILRGEPYSEKKLYITDKKIIDIAFIKKDANVSLMPYDEGVVEDMEKIYNNEGIRYFYIDQPGKAEDILPGLIGLAEKYPVDIFISYRINSSEEFEKSPYRKRIDFELVQ